MISKIYKRVHLPVYSTCLVKVITMTGYCRLQKGSVQVSKKKKKKKTQVKRNNYPEKEIKICSYGKPEPTC